MRRKCKVCHVLVAAGNDAGVGAIVKVLKGAASREELITSQAYTFSQVRQKISPYASSEAVDILIVRMPLGDETGIEQVLEMAGKNSQLQTILIVRREAFEQISYRCRNLQIFVLSLPVSLQVMSETVRFMMAVCRSMAERGEEVLQLRRKLSETGFITKAKCLLIQYRGMSEEDAHHYLERKAMNRCVSKKEIALEIIESAETEGMA